MSGVKVIPEFSLRDMKHFTAAVIGLGRIGQGYDYDKNADDYVLTHASAFTSHEGFDLIAGVDPDLHQRERFEKKFQRPVFKDCRTMFSKHDPDILALSIPTTLHYDVFREIISHSPRAVICEKPIAATYSDAMEMVRLARENECALLVNYMRRYEPGVLLLKSAIENGDAGEIYKGFVWYTKGLLNNASHYIDLLRFLLGEASDFEIFAKGQDWEIRNHEPDVSIFFGNTLIYFCAAREKCFELLEIDLIGTLGRIEYLRGGSIIEISPVIRDPIYENYLILNNKKRRIDNDMNRVQWHVVDHLYRHLNNRVLLNSDGESAALTLKIAEDIIKRIS